jgi:hypothetical protein
MHKLMVSGIVALVSNLSNAQAMTATSPAGLAAPGSSGYKVAMPRLRVGHWQ